MRFQRVTALARLCAAWRTMRNLGSRLLTVMLSLFSLMALTWVTEGLNGGRVLPDLLAIWWEPFYATPGQVGPRAQGTGFWLWCVPTGVLSLLLLWSSFTALNRWRRPRVRELVPPGQATPREVMVGMLSLLSDDGFQTLAGLTSPEALRAKLDAPALTTWTGKPLLFAIVHHYPHLKELHLLIGDDDASRQRLRQLRELLERISAGALRVTAHPVRDASDVQRLYVQLNAISRRLRRAGYDERQIIFDATGGTKPYSMAAAMATLHNDISLQYVETRGAHWRCTEYKVGIGREDALD